MAYEWGFGAQPDEWNDDEEWYDKDGNRHVGFESTNDNQFEYKIIDWFDENGEYHSINVSENDDFLRAGIRLFDKAELIQ